MADTPSNKQQRCQSVLFAAVVVLLLAAIPIQAVSSLVHKSATFDEASHLSSTYEYLVTGVFRQHLDHPPLADQIAAFPLLFLKLPLPTDEASQKSLIRFGNRFVYRNVRDADTILLWGRLPVVLLTVLLGWVVFSWGRELGHLGAGLLALFLCVFDPNILAHGRLATNDLAVTCFSFIAVYCFWKLLSSPGWINVLWAGLAFGTAQASKFSAVLLAPILMLLAALWLLSGREVRAPFPLPGSRLLARSPGLLRAYALVAVLLTLFLIGFVLVWADYRFEVGTVLAEGRQLSWLDERLDGSRWEPAVGYLFRELPVPAPKYFYGLAVKYTHTSGGRPAFLMGDLSSEGWWYYFLVAFLIKTPIPLLILLTVAMILTVVQRVGIAPAVSVIQPLDRRITNPVRARTQSTSFWEREAFLIVPVLTWFGVNSSSGFNLGYRHILPVLPFLFVFAGQVIQTSEVFRDFVSLERIRWRTVIVGLGSILCVWQLVGTLRVHPHYLAYFNELVSGPENGYKYLVDSNLDWGQDLKGLGAYLKAQRIDQVQLSYFGTADPAYYGIHYTCLPSFGILSKDKCPIESGFQDRAGVFAVSATHLQGVYLDDPYTFDWLKEREPEAVIGHSIFVYRVP
jgi:hypothetical protein